MKKIFKSILILLPVILTVLVFITCKRGKDDPTISFRSRKARVVGEWTYSVLKSEVNRTITDLNGILNTTIKESVNDGNMSQNTTEAENTYSQTSNGNGKVDFYKITFNDNGTFDASYSFSDLNATWVEIYGGFNNTSTTVSTMKYEASGTWAFMEGTDKNYKNKERIVLTIKSSVQTTTTLSLTGTTSTGKSSFTTSSTNDNGGSSTEIWDITNLSNKQLDIVGSVNGSGNSTSTFGTSTTSQNWTQSGSITGTLVQK